MRFSLLSLPVLVASFAGSMAGCDPNAAEQGKIEIPVDEKTLTNQILTPPGAEVPPALAKKAAQLESGSGATAPSKGKK